MFQIDSAAAYEKKDIADLFNVSTRTINNYYLEGLPKHRVGKINVTFGYEILKWIERDNIKEIQQKQINPKLEKFRTRKITM